MKRITAYNQEITGYRALLPLRRAVQSGRMDSLLPPENSGNGMSLRAGMVSPRGFTLIEIMLVMFIIALLAAIITPRLIGRTDDARVTQARVQIKNFETALKLFKMDNGFYPSTDQGLESLVRKPESGRIPSHYRKGGYLEKRAISPDPWDNPYVYLSPGTEGDFDIFSFGADSEPGGDGYDADLSNWDL